MTPAPRLTGVEMGCSQCDCPTYRPGLCDACQEASETCEHAGHEWAGAGGGLLVCARCMAERWDDDA